jgi:hypothetical protein
MKVCVRWRHLCSSDDLWIQKCLDLGHFHSISGLLKLIRKKLPNEDTLDWRMAYIELSEKMEQVMKPATAPPELSVKCELYLKFSF